MPRSQRPRAEDQTQIEASTEPLRETKAEAAEVDSENNSRDSDKGSSRDPRDAIIGVLKSGGILRSARRALQSINGELIAVVLAFKALIFVFGYLSWQIIENKRSIGWLALWNRWDGANYQTLAAHGYQAAGDERFLLVYFPLFPWLARFVGVITGGPLIGAFVVSGIALIVAVILLDRLSVLDGNDAGEHWAVWFLLIFPTSYFLHIGYTESLFLALTLGAFFAARRDRWMVAGLVGFFAALTRANGLILIPALAFEAWTEYRTPRRWRSAWLWILLIGLGFVVYLFLNHYISGEYWRFLAYQREHWFRSFGWPWVGIREAYGSFIGRPPEDSQMVGAQEVLFAFIGLACTIWSWRSMRPSYSIWMTGNWLLFTSTPFLQSVPRYTLMMFPIFFLFARAARVFFWRIVLTAWSILFLALFAANFARGHWTF